MKRTFAPITVDELRNKIQSVMPDEDYIDLLNHIRKDLKVDFDSENFSMSEEEFGPRNLMGYRTLENGLTFCGMCAGGDW